MPTGENIKYCVHVDMMYVPFVLIFWFPDVKKKEMKQTKPKKKKKKNKSEEQTVCKGQWGVFISF